MADQLRRWRGAGAENGEPDASGWVTMRVQFEDEEQARFIALGARADVVGPREPLTSASFSSRSSRLMCHSSRRARGQSLTRHDHASATGRRERVYFEALPDSCAARRRSRSTAEPV